MEQMKHSIFNILLIKQISISYELAFRNNLACLLADVSPLFCRLL